MSGNTENVYENIIVHSLVPTPRRSVIVPKIDDENKLEPIINDTEASSSRMTGAIRKTPNGENDLDKAEIDEYQEKYSNVISQTPPTSDYSSGDSNNTTPNPCKSKQQSFAMRNEDCKISNRSYEEILKENEVLKQKLLAQSLHSNVHKQNNLGSNKISSDSSDDNESVPPKIPPPQLTYGRKLFPFDNKNAPMVPPRNAATPPLQKAINDSSDTINANKVNSRQEKIYGEYEILKQFDPLPRDKFIKTEKDHMSQLETIFTEEIYETIDEHELVGENSNAESVNALMTPEHNDSVATTQEANANQNLKTKQVDGPLISGVSGLIETKEPTINSQAHKDIELFKKNYLQTYEKLKSNEFGNIGTVVPRPRFSENVVHTYCKSFFLFKLSFGGVGDVLKEISPRFVELEHRRFKAYFDEEFKILKEHLDLTYLTSIQFLLNHKFKSESGRQIYCFEVNLAIPKNLPNGTLSLENKGVPVKTQQVTYVYGVDSKNECCFQMQKLIRCVTNVFPKEYSLDYTRAGWCYMKKSISSAWSGTWIMLSHRKLLFYDFSESRLEILDLRKARCIGIKESDDSTQNLFIEKGPTMLIDCPPYTCYFVMNSPKETETWSILIKDEAHTNGTQLRHQQLTKDDVPVIVDKCIEFIYTYGTFSVGIYRKGGWTKCINKLLTALRKDAFSVQIARREYNEHDVSSAMKLFLKQMPEPIMGKHAVSFLSVKDIKLDDVKYCAYRELLHRLPSVEYQTLKKILGHLHFIQAQHDVNKIRAEDLAMVFGPILMQPNHQDQQYQVDQKERDVIAELIMNYKKLYDLTEDEIKNEQMTLTRLQKHHSKKDTVKKSDAFSISITIDPNPELNLKQEDKKQVNVLVTPEKTVYELCKDFESQMKIPAHQMTLMEVILNGNLQRPLHYSEKVLNNVLKWANWPDDDRKTNYLELRPKTKFQQQIERALKTLPSLMPFKELNFADRKTKLLKQFTLELSDTYINVLKVEKQTVKLKEIEVQNCVVYLGAEKNRNNQMRWALTLVELNFTQRTRDSPFIGHIMGGNDLNDQVTWYTSIQHSLHGDDFTPNSKTLVSL